MKNRQWLLCFVCCCAIAASAQTIVTPTKATGSFALATAKETPTIVYDPADDSLVVKAAYLFRDDVESITGKKLPVSTTLGLAKTVIVIGNIQHSKIIRQLAAEKKINVSSLRAKWEAYQIQVVKHPFKRVRQALVIAGSDRRGTAYGLFELSRQMGVSPWHWWADVPVKTKKELYLKPAAFLTDAPKVKYRGIFINDEAPALSGWSKEKFGGFTHLFYEKVFQLMLRLKANYLWPAMWGNAFYDDDQQNRQMADNYGIVIGTSHHEPLMRAHDEWRRYGTGKWNYDSNEVRLKNFWREGIQRATNEKIVSVGMRGDGDEPMSRETATALLEKIAKDQRQIIEDVTGRPAAETPQLWALYKEVQDYYDKGMRVPDDVTLLLCDDNWGNIRKLPKPGDAPRSGGYGIYYHFDYVGGPRNYKWLNTNNLARVWEQMHLAYRHGVDRIWIVNVGDIKPMELPTSFFLDYAWNPEAWNESNIRTYYTKWAKEQFGSKSATEIGDILRRYSQYSARRKPELLDATTYSLTAYGEAERVIKEWRELQSDAEKVNAALPAEYSDAFFQLVLHPVKALTNLHELYWNVALNRINAKDSILSANTYADAAKQLYRNDSLISLQYHQLGKGKWNHMMSQTHIGYTYWQQPPFNKMPEVQYLVSGRITDTTGSKSQPIPPAISFIPKNIKGNVFYQQANYVSIEAENWTRATNTPQLTWKVIPDIGKTGSGITTFPVTVAAASTTNSPHVAYDFYSVDPGTIALTLYFSPTLNFYNDGLQYAVSIDDEAPQIMTLNKREDVDKAWGTWVANNIILKTTSHTIGSKGKHTIKYQALSPGVILQKLVVHFGNAEQSYLGPPQTKYTR